MRTIPRYFIENNGVNVANEQAILSHALAQYQNDSKLIIFVTPTLENTQIFERLFTGKDVKIFINGVRLTNQNNIVVKHVSFAQYFKNPPSSHVLISTFIDSERIFELEDKEIAIANYVLPSATDRIEKWAKTTRAINIVSGAMLDAYPLPQQEIIDSINRIMVSVNPSGFSTDDMALVKREFRALRNNGIQLNRDEIEAYAITLVDHFAWGFVKQIRNHAKI